MWSFKQWLYEYRDKKYEQDTKHVLSLIQADLDKVTDLLTPKHLKDMFKQHGIGPKYYETFPIILTMRTGDITHIHALPSQEIEDAVCAVAIKWWATIRKSKHSFCNRFILYKALEAIGQHELAEAHRLYLCRISDAKLQSDEIKWKMVQKSV